MKPKKTPPEKEGKKMKSPAPVASPRNTLFSYFKRSTSSKGDGDEDDFKPMKKVVKEENTHSKSTSQKEDKGKESTPAVDKERNGRKESPRKKEKSSKNDADSEDRGRERGSASKKESPVKSKSEKDLRKESPSKSKSRDQEKKKESPSKSKSKDRDARRESPSKSKSKDHSSTKETPPESKKKDSSSSKSRDKEKNGKKKSPVKAEVEMKEENGKATPKGKAAKKEKTPSKGKDSVEKTEEEKKAAEAERKKNYFRFLTTQSIKPPNLGAKPIPIGAPGCLQDLTFVMSGVLDSLEREDAKKLIEKYGGRVTTSISKKTSYLIVGLESGVSKTAKATELKVPLMTEDDLLEMIRKSNPNGGNEVESQDSGWANSDDFMDDSEEVKEESDYDAEKSLFSSPASVKREHSPRKLGVSKLATEESPSRKKPKLEPEASTSTVVKREVEEEERRDVKPRVPVVVGKAEPMWVDKYRPTTLKNVVGQAGDKSNAAKLVKWLQNWFKYHGKSDDKAKAKWPGLRDPEGNTFKAALLSGPPGIGKTTTAHLAVKEVGYDYYELNASDTRNKRGLHENVADALSNKTLVFGKSDEEMTRKHVLIMDEVDGMSGNEDRGGVQELLTLIKKSRVPIICICNDRGHPKIRSLANYCFDLQFHKPSFEQLRGFISKISFREKLKIPAEKVQQLILSTDNDIRQILHQLELFKEGQSEQAFNPRKDLRFGPWDVVRKVFLKSDHRNMSIHDKAGLFFQDYSLGPLFVQENYLKFYPSKAGSDKYKALDLIAKSAASLANGDLTDNMIRRAQNWSLLPVQAIFSSYIPGELMEADTLPLGKGIDFPAWLGKNSNTGKRHRLLQTMHTHMQLHISGSLEALNMDYLPYLRRKITKPLVVGDTDSAAEVMEDYTLLRDDVDSIIDLSLWPGTQNPMEKIEPKVKAAFTRKVNKDLVLPYSMGKPVKGKGKAGGGGDAMDELDELLGEGEGEAVVEEEEEEDDSPETDGMVKKKTKRAGSSKSQAGSRGGGGGQKRKKPKDDDYDDDEDDDEEEFRGKRPKSSKGTDSKSKSRKK